MASSVKFNSTNNQCKFGDTSKSTTCLVQCSSAPKQRCWTQLSSTKSLATSANVHLKPTVQSTLAQQQSFCHCVINSKSKKVCWVPFPFSGSTRPPIYRSCHPAQRKRFLPRQVWKSEGVKWSQPLLPLSNALYPRTSSILPRAVFATGSRDGDKQYSGQWTSPAVRVETLGVFDLWRRIWQSLLTIIVHILLHQQKCSGWNWRIFNLWIGYKNRCWLCFKFCCVDLKFYWTPVLLTLVY